MDRYKAVTEALLLTPKTWLITGVAGFIGSNLLEYLLELNQRVVGLDCWADSAEAEHEYGISLTEKPEQGSYSSVIVAVPHREYAAMSAGDLRGYLKERGVLFDLKGIFPLGEADLRL